MASPTILSVAFCICDETTLTDFIPPCEILASANCANTVFFPEYLQPLVSYRFRFEFIAPSMRPVTAGFRGGGMFGPTINPTKTYQQAMKEDIQYDVIWVPAGPLPNLNTMTPRTPQDELEFIRFQAPGAKYIVSVCTGAAILAEAGLLSGKRATTNKMFFRVVEAMSPKDVEWVPVARWIVDGNIWTSSGVIAGTDMTLAFMEHLMGRQVAQHMRAHVEVIEHKQDEDPFAAEAMLGLI
ncbi:class I glutamine amidotransferase-like protein [Cylindrobasidium torrendii FP15055 ss-10]|uniref:Class I glutamine amidotransferase-like protein n=1 Tax=Cylindrobasidium torrendii FP15055 ss-10 TaxID=1314674 RepID=A0A0D7B7X3_9AGAR|nr:class I glutamine amidotransferase-like protein [Cylindrobasidium torrendii FP15055 ss-10]